MIGVGVSERERNRERERGRGLVLHGPVAGIVVDVPCEVDIDLREKGG